MSPLHSITHLTARDPLSILNAMQYSNMALETTALVMYDPGTFFYVVQLFVVALRKTYITHHKHHLNIISKM